MRPFIAEFMVHHTCSRIEVVQNRLELLQPCIHLDYRVSLTLIMIIAIGLIKISCT